MSKDESSHRRIGQRAAAIAWGYAAGHVLTPAPWKILMVLARRVNNKRSDFDVWPHLQTIATDANLSVSTIQRHIKSLESRGFIRRRKRTDSGRGFTGWLYELNVKASFEMPTGEVVRHDFTVPVEEKPSGQSDVRRVVNGDLHRVVTVDHSHIEPLNGEPLNGEPPMIPMGDDDVDRDLFGQIQQSAGDSRVAVEQAIEAYVSSEWTALSAENPLIPKFRKLDDGRRKAVIRCASAHISADLSGKQVWETAFREIRQSRFLRGLSAPGRERSSVFSVKFDWLLKPANFKKVIEGNYNDRTDGNEHFDPVTNQPLAPHDVARNRINERLLRSQQRAAARENPSAAPAGRIGYSNPSGR